MNEELQDRWVAALLSGEYKQGEGYLRQRCEDGPDAFCCLGVLCDLMYPEDWEQDSDPEEDHSYWKFWHHQGTSGIPSLAVAQEAGIYEVCDKLSGLNDHGYSFEQIARYIKGEYIESEEPARRVPEPLEPSGS